MFATLLPMLGSIFSSARIYLYIGIAVAGLGLFAYVEHLKLVAADAQATVASQAATINETKDALKVDEDTIIKLQVDAENAQAALQQAHEDATVIQQQLFQAQETLNAIPEPKTCQTLDARDRAAIDGVRRLLGVPTPNRPDKGHH